MTMMMIYSDENGGDYQESLVHNYIQVHVYMWL